MPLPLGIPDLPSQVLQEQTHLSLPSQPHWIQPAVEYLVQKAILTGACHESRSGRLLLTLHEAISNAMIHGNLEIESSLKENGDDLFAQVLAKRSADPKLASRVVDIFVDYDGRVCRWVITDQGNGFDVDQVLHRALCADPEVLLASGRGILLMRAFVDELRYEFGGRRLILSLNRANGEEKRKETRLPIHQPVRIAPLSPEGIVDWSQAVEAISRNFSDTGVALLQGALGPVGKIAIGVSINDQMVYLPAEVRHMRTLPGNMVEIGCQFLTTVSEGMGGKDPTFDKHLSQVQEALSGMLESRRRHTLPEGERRSFPRMIFTEKVEIRIDHKPKAIIGYARDLSKRGVAFITQVPISGEITMVVPARKTGPTLKVRCQVVRCLKVKEGFYDVGAMFLNLEPGE